MKKITFISVLLATAVFVNVTAQRRTSSSANDDRQNRKAATSRNYSEKSGRSNSQAKTYNRSSTVNHKQSTPAKRKTIATSSRNDESHRSRSMKSDNRRSKNATTRRNYSDNSSRANSGAKSYHRSKEKRKSTGTRNRKDITAPSRKVESRRHSSSNRGMSRGSNRSDNVRTYKKRDVKREASSAARRPETDVQRSVDSRRNRKYSYKRNEVNASRTVRHYPTHRKYVRKKHVHVHVHKPRSIEYRARYYPYRRPVHVNITWTPRVYRKYCVIYPELRRWRYHRGYVVHTISAYDAYYHMGEVRRVYGKVTDTYYAYETDEYFLYIGARYPYQDFTVVVPGYIARNYHRNPERFFYRNHIEATGLITSYEGEPEMVVKKHYQLKAY